LSGSVQGRLPYLERFRVAFFEALFFFALVFLVADFFFEAAFFAGLLRVAGLGGEAFRAAVFFFGEGLPATDF
jgi:hypothetical protein